MRRQREQHVRDHRVQPIGAAPEVIELADEIEESEEREQRHEDEQARGENLAGEIAEQHSRSMPNPLPS